MQAYYVKNTQNLHSGIEAYEQEKYKALDRRWQ